jgi:hypothetical protein
MFLREKGFPRTPSKKHSHKKTKADKDSALAVFFFCFNSLSG